MSRWFNTAGPCKGDIHYMLPPTVRLPNLERLIEQQNYFVIHAPRQTGKTTAMLALAKQLIESGRYTAVMVSAEVGSPFRDRPETAELAILDAWRSRAMLYLPPDLQPPDNWDEAQPGRRIQAALQAWAQAQKRSVVLFIDEIDSLQNQALISVLRQLRDGYSVRPQNFLISVGLIGLRNATAAFAERLPLGEDRVHQSPARVENASCALDSPHSAGSPTPLPILGEGCPLGRGEGVLDVTKTRTAINFLN